MEKKHLIATLFFGAVAWSALLGGGWYYFQSGWPDDTQLSDGTTLKWTSCPWALVGDKSQQCAHLTLNSDEQTHRLAVMRIPYTGDDQQSDPLLYINGGPGGSAGITDWGADYWADLHSELKLKRDLYVFDPRGVGESKPSYRCPEVLEANETLLTSQESIEKRVKIGYDSALACIERLKKERRSLADLTTPQFRDDTLSLMRAVQIDGERIPQWNIYGVSYGSRLAMDVMRHANAGEIRSVTLDGVYPPEVDAVHSWPSLIDDAFDRLETWCENDDACNEQHGNWRQHLGPTLLRLNEQPITLSLSEQDMMLDGSAYLDVLFNALYWWESAEKVPGIVVETARNGAGEALESIADDYVFQLLDPDFSDPVFYSVECYDSPPLDIARYQAEVDAYPELKPVLQPYVGLDLCRDQFAVNPALDAFREPLRSEIPTLLLSGELDPVTPPSWAERAQRGLIDAQHIEFSGIGHGTLDSSECAVDAVRDFINNPQATVVSECLESDAF